MSARREEGFRSGECISILPFIESPVFRTQGVKLGPSPKPQYLQTPTTPDPVFSRRVEKLRLERKLKPWLYQ